MQVGAGFKQMRGEAVPEQVGIHPLLNPGTAGGILAGVAGGLGIDGPRAGVPAINGKQPGAGFFPQAPPVCAEFVEQNGTEHYVAVLATLAALDVNHHPSAINVADLQASQLRVPNTGGIEGHEDSLMEWCASRIDELGHFFLTENGGLAVRLLRVRSVGNAPRSLQCLDVEKPQGTQMVGYRAG